MTIQTIERLVGELLSTPEKPLSPAQKNRAYEFAAGLYAGRVGDIRCSSGYSLREMQALRALAHKQSFYLEYFKTAGQGRRDAALLGLDSAADAADMQAKLLAIETMTANVSPKQRKEIAARSAEWARSVVTAQLARDEATDESYTPPLRQTVNYNPDKLLEKAASVRAYREFYAQVQEAISREPDSLLAQAEHALLELHIGRLRAMAAVDVFPGLLSLEDQLTRSKQSTQVAEWTRQLRLVAPAIAAIRQLTGEARIAAREAYARHLDAIRQGAPFELDAVDEQEATLFSRQAFDELLLSLTALSDAAPLEKTALGAELEQIRWHATDIQQFIEDILRRWDMLSDEQVAWSDVDYRDGFASDGKFQVIVTPQRKNMSVDSTRRIINIPAAIERPLAGLYPAGALPLIAHELAHVLQAYGDYELGQHIPLARLKGRRYRILREAGGVYQEYLLARDYFGLNREPNMQYVHAYRAKVLGASRVGVARAFYNSHVEGKTLSAAEDAAARELAVNRTARLYRYGGHSSQVLDYVEQSIVCSVLLQCLEPQQVNVFLLGGASFSLEDSARLHRFGLYELPGGTAHSPAEEVIGTFLNAQAATNPLR